MTPQTALKAFGQRWLPTLLIGWAAFQALDILLTYGGLTFRDHIHEANPVMAGIISDPSRVILTKAAITIGVIVLLLRIEYRSRFSSIPVLALLNALMMYVFFNNWSLIARAGSRLLMTHLGG